MSSVTSLNKFSPYVTAHAMGDPWVVHGKPWAGVGAHGGTHAHLHLPWALRGGAGTIMGVHGHAGISQLR